MAHDKSLSLILSLSASLLALAGGAGCGADEVPLEDYPHAVLTSYCAWASECGEFGDLDSCIYYLGDDESLILPAEIRNAIVNGTIAYDAQQAGECIAALEGANCSLFGFSDTLESRVCTDAFAGTLEDGQLCFLELQCASGWCDVDYESCESACCAGACLAAPAEGVAGQVCPYSGCDDDTYCHWESDTCQARKGIGAPCDYTEECASGALCFGYPGVCDVPREEGQPCLEGECGRMGLTCDPTRSLCVPVQTSGEVCNPSVDLCGESLSCDEATNTCRSAPTIGEPCTYECGGYQVYCESEGYGVEGVCAPRKNHGEDCYLDDECLSRYCGDNARCAELPVCVL